MTRPPDHSPNRKILRAAVIVGGLTVLTKVVATVKELLVARSFGRGDAVDAFLIAYLVPSFVQNMVVGSLTVALIPKLVDLRHREGDAAVERLASSLTTLAVAGLATLAAVLAVIGPFLLPYLGSNFSPEKRALTSHLLAVVVPVIVFGGFAACATAILNAGEQFAWPAAIPVLTPIVTMAFIQAAPSWGAFTLAAGMVAGGLAEAVALAIALRARGWPLPLRWHGLDPAVVDVLRQYAPMLAGAFLAGGTGLIDQAMAAMLAPGSVAALGYGNRIAGTVAVLASSSLAAAALPYLSQLVTAGDIDACRHVLKRYAALAFAAGTPVAVLLIVFSRSIVGLVFERGAFTAADTLLVSHVQAGYAIQIPFYTCSAIFIRFLSSMRRNDLLMWAAAASLALDIVLNLVMMRIWGVAGIAVSTSLVAAVALAIVAACAASVLRGVDRARAGQS